MSTDKLTDAELEQRAAERAEKQQADAKARRRLELELDEKYSAEGVRGIDYEIVVTDIGVYVVGKPEFNVAKQFNLIPADKRTEEDCVKFVTPSVKYPTQEAYRAILQTHCGIIWRLTAAMLGMYEARATTKSGEF